ncbi:hypothetical protein IW248_001349 [Micromonospora ureilytica]|uniref:Uncharacterized protein n=1 Tax=Micromonospora ureilytica TaxID=709868 RepID=A0ABS0JEF7_9ACTN|nr:hypothetical protein [Micromonospora ureilytica]
MTMSPVPGSLVGDRNPSAAPATTSVIGAR